MEKLAAINMIAHNHLTVVTSVFFMSNTQYHITTTSVNYCTVHGFFEVTVADMVEESTCGTDISRSFSTFFRQERLAVKWGLPSVSNES
jgi:hypothetical protein